MRRIYLALAVVTVPSTGCSAFVASRGEDFNALTTKEQVRHAFGAPIASGDGPFFDEFRTHRKIAERWKGEGLFIGCVATLGLSEFVCLPRELFLAARQCVVGQDVRFVYNAEGNVLSVLVNGEVPLDYGHRGTSPTATAASGLP